MKTVLDEHDDIFLDRLSEDDKLTCRVIAYKLEKLNKVPDYEFCYDVDFEFVDNYVVLEEFIESTLGNTYLDNDYLTECTSSEISKTLQIKEIFGEDIKHYTLRTAHTIVHVFASTIPKVIRVQSDMVNSD